MQKRTRHLQRVRQSFDIHPVVALLGPRQCGKTTLAHQYAKQRGQKCHLFDLEDPEDLAALENPKAVFGSLPGSLIIDEIQHMPELFSYLRVLVDREKRKRKILLLGSASKELIQKSSETLAGRIVHIEPTPFGLHELKVSEQKKSQVKMWQRGGFPLSFLAGTETQSFAWRKAYAATFLKRDLPTLGIKIPARTLHRFWTMLAHYHANNMNYSEMGRSFGVADTTIRKYLDILTETFMIRQLEPWHENSKKRQVKSPKIYFRDSGIYHTLLNIKNQRELLSHPKLGASWEGFALEQVLQYLELDGNQVFFWSVHGQGGIDLLFTRGAKRYGVEFKFASAPSVSKSMHLAKEQLGLHRLFCVHSGEKSFPLADGIEAWSLGDLKTLAARLNHEMA